MLFVFTFFYIISHSSELCLPTSGHSSQGGEEVKGVPMPENHFHCTGMAQHALVLGSSSHVEPDPPGPAQPIQSANSTIQSDSTQESVKPKSPCLAPRASTNNEQGFSTRSVYEAKWAIFTNWCHSNQVDFRAPSINSIANFLLLYLFHNRKLQPSTDQP